MSQRVLFVGEISHDGCNSGAMAQALARRGAVVHVVDSTKSIPTPHSQGVFTRAVYRLCRPLFVRQYNKRIAADLRFLYPELLIVYKGQWLQPWPLVLAREMKTTCYNIYPDVSAFTHGSLIPRCLPLYDHIFTTKTFGLHDFQKHFRARDVSFLPHGFDPCIHRPMRLGNNVMQQLGNDVSFIGTWSLKKEKYLTAVAEGNKAVNFKIWGAQWEKCTTAVLKPHIVGRDIVGSLYAAAIQCSRVNIALLSEARTGASSGDRTTSRTFHIPASGGFMLHERTEELADFFTEDQEVACFASPEELSKKVEFYLTREEDRQRIRQAGHQRCVQEDSMDSRAARILAHYSNSAPEIRSAGAFA